MWLEEKNRSSQNNKNLILTDFNDFLHVSLSRLLVTLDTDKYSLKNNHFSIGKRRSNSFLKLHSYCNYATIAENIKVAVAKEKL